MNILEEIYNGEYRPFERDFSGDERYRELIHNVGKKRKALASLLDGEEHNDVFTAYTDASDELYSYAELIAFMDGFRLGARLLLETSILQDHDWHL